MWRREKQADRKTDVQTDRTEKKIAKESQDQEKNRKGRERERKGDNVLLRKEKTKSERNAQKPRQYARLREKWRSRNKKNEMKKERARKTGEPVEDSRREQSSSFCSLMQRTSGASIGPCRAAHSRA